MRIQIKNMKTAWSVGMNAKRNDDFFSVLLLIGWKGGASFLDQSQSEVSRITFDTKLKIALIWQLIKTKMN